MKRLLVLLISAIGIVVGCSGEEDTTGTIKGEVYNAHTGTVIAVANVYTVPPSGSVSTDSSGLFTIENIEPEIYRVVASKHGFDSSSVSVSVSTGNVTTANIPLNPDSVSADTTLFLY